MWGKYYEDEERAGRTGNRSLHHANCALQTRRRSLHCRLATNCLLRLQLGQRPLRLPRFPLRHPKLPLFHQQLLVVSVVEQRRFQLLPPPQLLQPASNISLSLSAKRATWLRRAVHSPLAAASEDFRVAIFVRSFVDSSKAGLMETADQGGEEVFPVVSGP
jgi:hypothetical protein